MVLAGTPGTLVKRTGTGHAYWYRVYYPVPGIQAEHWVCKEGDGDALQDAEQLPGPRRALSDHPQTLEQFELALR